MLDKILMSVLFSILCSFNFTPNSEAQSFMGTLSFSHTNAMYNTTASAAVGVVRVGGKKFYGDGNTRNYRWCDTCFSSVNDSFNVIRNSNWQAGRCYLWLPDYIDTARYKAIFDQRYVMLGRDTVTNGPLMTKFAAESAIAVIDEEIDGKANSSTTITINGDTKDLSVNRSWSVGTLIGADTLNLSSSKLNISDAIANYQLKGNYLTSYTETDPTVASYIKSISSTNISNWNTAFSWGNHGIQGYLKGADTVSLSNRINDKFNIPTGSNLQYIRGNGSLATFPTNISNFTNDLGYLTSSVANTLYKGINYTPSSSEINTALGYTPYNGTTNVNGYISSYTETDPLFNSKFSAKSTTDLAEGTNLYFTNARVNSAAISAGFLKMENDPIWLTEKVNYLTTGNAASLYQPLGSYATTVQLATKLNIADTASMLSAYLRTNIANSSFYPISSNPAGYLTSINSSNVTTALGFTPVTNARTISINGTSQDLSSNRTWTNIGIELPSQTGNSGKILGTNGTTPSWITGITDAFTIKTWNKNSQLSTNGILVTDTFSITGSTPTITLTLPTGTTVAKVLSATGYRTGASVSNSPQVAISSYTDTSVSLVISQQNTATVTILGINVLSGLPMILVPDPTNIKIVISYIAY